MVSRASQIQFYCQESDPVTNEETLLDLRLLKDGQVVLVYMNDPLVGFGDWGEFKRFAAWIHAISEMDPIETYANHFTSDDE